jgi:hypothetical protein
MKPCMGVRASEREKKILFKRKEDSFLFLMQLLDKTATACFRRVYGGVHLSLGQAQIQETESWTRTRA